MIIVGRSVYIGLRDKFLYAYFLDGFVFEQGEKSFAQFLLAFLISVSHVYRILLQMIYSIIIISFKQDNNHLNGNAAQRKTRT